MTKKSNTERRADQRGERNNSSKLTDDQVRYVLGSPRLGVDLARELGVHPSTISLIRAGKKWTHL